MRNVKLQLYLEGLQVPINAATISGEVSSSVACSLILPPGKNLKKLRPRTLVHLFYLDDTLPKPKESEKEDRWRCAFEGEFLGYGYKKSSGEYNIVLRCLDLSCYWENALYYYMNLASSLGFGFADKMRFLGIQKAHYEMATNLVIEGAIYKKIEKANSMVEAIHNILSDINEINSFYSNAKTRLKLSNRIISKTSEKMTDLFEKDYLIDWLKQEAGTYGGSVSLITILNYFLKVVYHDWVINTAPAYIGGKVLNFLIKPNLFFTAPPKCNVFFPDEIDWIDYSRNHLQEPTRIMKTRHSLLEKDASARDISCLNATIFPEALADMFEKSSEMSRFYISLLQDEREKGIIPIITSEDSAQSMYNSAAKKGGGSSVEKYAKQGAAYDFAKAKYQNRSLPIVLGFTPRIVGGFPAAVIDTSILESTFLGYITNWEHSISADGIGTTSLQLGYSRTLDEDAPDLPAWYDDKYQNQWVGTRIYQELLGCDSFFDGESISAILNDVNEVINEYNEYELKGWIRKFVDDYTRRNIASKDEVFAFLGATSEDGINYKGGPFIDAAGAEKYGIPNKQEIVIEYLKEIKYQGQKM